MLHIDKTDQMISTLNHHLSIIDAVVQGEPTDQFPPWISWRSNNNIICISLTCRGYCLCFLITITVAPPPNPAFTPLGSAFVGPLIPLRAAVTLTHLIVEEDEWSALFAMIDVGFGWRGKVRRKLILEAYVILAQCRLL